MRKLTAVLCCLAALMPCWRVAAQTERERGMRLIARDPATNENFPLYNEAHALLIGINTYPYGPPLDYAVADAGAIKDLLIQKLGFKSSNVTLITNQAATQQGIKRAFGNLNNVGKDDCLVVFFAGHGETVDLPSGGQMGFLVPYDGKGGSNSEVYSTCISMQDLRELSSFIPAKHVLYLVDACYGGLAASQSRSMSREEKGFFKKMVTARSREILTAGGRGEKVFERAEWGHSAFTYKLLDGLGKGLADADDDGLIRGIELAAYIQKSVSTLTSEKQTPKFQSEDEGDFVFVLPEAARAATAAIPSTSSNVRVTSTPDQADIFVDGRPVNLKTPADLPRLSPGSHQIEARRGTQQASRSVIVDATRQIDVDLPLGPATGTLEISSTPPDADILIDGFPRGRTPALISSLAGGSHMVTIRKDGYADMLKSVDVRPPSAANLNVRLMKPGSLDIQSQPAGADVYVEGKLAGKTPLQIPGVTPGKVNLKITKADFNDWTGVMPVVEGALSPVVAKLISQYASLSVTSSPDGADVFIDGKLAGKTPIHAYRARTGDRDVRLAMADHDDWRNSVSLLPETERELTVELKSIVGTLTMTEVPPEAEVFVDGKSAGKGPVLEQKLSVGEHVVSINHPGYGRVPEEHFSIASDMKKRMTAEMGVQSTGAVWRSVLLPGWGQFWDGAPFEGATFMVAGGAGIALALMAQTDYKDKLASYNTAADAYANATASNEPLLRAGLNSAYSSLTSAHDKRSLMIYGALGIYVLNLADAFLLHSKEMRINTLSDYHGSSLTPSVWGVQGSLAAGFRFKHTW